MRSNDSRRARNQRNQIGFLALVFLGFACDDVADPDFERRTQARRDNLSDFEAIVSDPGPAIAPSAEASVTGFVYVSLLPGSIDEAGVLRIRNLASRIDVEAALVDGGLDPVLINAAVFDTLELTAFAGDEPVAKSIVVVAETRKPRVVRTEPPRGKRDVPLNATIRVVFSEPMDAAALDTASLQLTSNGRPVPVETGLRQNGLVAELTPMAPLEAGATYTITVGVSAHDLGGESLEEAYVTYFETAEETAAAPSAASLTLDEDSITAHARDGVILLAVATIRDAEGNELTDVPIRWTTSDSAIASAGEHEVNRDAGVVVGRGRTGSVVIRAEVPESQARDSLVLTLIDVSIIPLRRVEVGETGVCVVATSGKLYCNGESPTSVNSATWTEVPGNAAFGVVSIGWHHACALDQDGGAHCWGGNSNGELGSDRCYGQYVGECLVRVPSRVVGGLSFVQIVSGRFHNCALTAAGQAYCWGHGGVLGDGLVIDRTSPTPVVGEFTFRALDAARGTTCGLTTSGDIYCWGYGYTTYESDTSSIPSVIVAPVALGFEFVDLSVGYEIAGTFGPGEICGLTTDGKPICWPLGDVAPLNPTPVPISVLLVDIDGGMGPHTCGQSQEGAVYCWGRSYDDNYFSAPFGPRHISGFTAASYSSGGGGFDSQEPHACAVGINGALFCWIGPDGDPARIP